MRMCEPIKAEIVYHDDDQDKTCPLAYVHAAKQDVVDMVLRQPENTEDGRSNWVWIRLSNGDLILGVYPCGDTYFACEQDAQYPHNRP